MSKSNRNIARQPVSRNARTSPSAPRPVGSNSQRPPRQADGQSNSGYQGRTPRTTTANSTAPTITGRRSSSQGQAPKTTGTNRTPYITQPQTGNVRFPSDSVRQDYYRDSLTEGIARSRRDRQENENQGSRAAAGAPNAKAKKAHPASKGRPPLEAPRAKKLVQRAPNQKQKLHGERLRELRVDIDDLEPIRLQKALALGGAGSRRSAEELISQGKVTVNGRVAQLGDKVLPKDRIQVNGKAVFVRWPDRLPRVLAYHKEEGEMVTRDDPEGRTTVFDRLPQTRSSRWVAVGRLDINTSGLLLFTTSGELANRMTHPSFEVEREYAVRVLGALSEDDRKQLLAGIELEDGEAGFQRIIDQGGEGANHWYRVVIREGRNREVRRLFEHFGLTVSRLIRVRFGAVELPSRLKRGQVYELNESEVARLMKWAGLEINGLASE